jgi:hypothetical protein
MSHDGYWCHDCQCEVRAGSAFRACATAAHAITAGVPEAQR